MISPPSQIRQEMHKLQSSGSLVWLSAIEEHSIYLARAIQNITWNTRTWIRSWFEVDGIDEDGNDRSPDLFVHLNNIGGITEQELLERDNLRNAWVDLYCVNSNLLDLTDYVYHVRLQAQKVVCTRKTASIKVGLNNPLYQSFPAWKLHGSVCQYPVFPGDTRCGYVGDIISCNRSWSDCVVRHGATTAGERFGAQFGLINENWNED